MTSWWNRKIRRSVRLVPKGTRAVGRPLLIAARFRRKAKGLLFSPEHAGALLLAPCNDVHTAGMRHRLDIAFVDAQAGARSPSRRGAVPEAAQQSAEAVVERFSSCATPWFTAGDRVGVVCMKGDRK